MTKIVKTFVPYYGDSRQDLPVQTYTYIPSSAWDSAITLPFRIALEIFKTVTKIINEFNSEKV